MQPDPRLPGYLLNNDPLPEKLYPFLSLHTHFLGRVIASCDRQQSALEAAIFERRAAIDALSRELDGLQRVLDRLDSQKSDAQAQKTRFQSTSSPLRRVPPEIIANVFAFALESDDDFIGSAERKEFMHYRSVSKLWRSVAFSTPALWRTVRLATVDPRYPFSRASSDDAGRRDMFNVLKSWLSRGGKDAPIRVSFPFIPGINVADILSFVRTSELRIKYLALGCEGTRTAIRRIQDLRHLSMEGRACPSVSMLTLVLPECSAFPPALALDINSSFPNLEALDTADISTNHPSLRVFFAHKTLTILNITSFFYAASTFISTLR